MITRVLYMVVSKPSIVFVLCLGAIMFKSPSLKTLPFDRIAFLFTFIVAILSFWFYKGNTRILVEPIAFPMLALTIMGTVSAVQVRFDIERWSFLANKFIVPFSMFFIAKMVFKNEWAVRHFFVFCITVLTYLTLLSVSHLIGADFLIYPSYILDPTLGIHAERARGPFLQAVANGTAINILGLLLLHWCQNRNVSRTLVILFFMFVSLAIAATMTRAVWLSFGLSILILVIVDRTKRVRNIGLAIALVAATAAVVIVMTTDLARPLSERTGDMTSTDFRIAVYQAAFKMFGERPIAGWGTNEMSLNISKYISGYTTSINWAAHNTYLEIIVEHGVIGFAFYAAILFFLFRVGKNISRFTGSKFALIDRQFVSVWRVVLFVYLFNGMFVVMNYQFINVILFTIAGILSAADSGIKCQTESNVSVK
jgi:putative inorganic carbon (hco3(-)) transporter